MLDEKKIVLKFISVNNIIIAKNGNAVCIACARTGSFPQAAAPLAGTSAASPRFGSSGPSLNARLLVVVGLEATAGLDRVCACPQNSRSHGDLLENPLRLPRGAAAASVVVDSPRGGGGGADAGRRQLLGGGGGTPVHRRRVLRPLVLVLASLARLVASAASEMLEKSLDAQLKAKRVVVSGILTISVA